MVAVELHDLEGRGGVLGHDAQVFFHLRGHGAVGADEAGRAVLEAARGTHVLDAFAQGVLGGGEHGFEGFGVGGVGLGAVLGGVGVLGGEALQVGGVGLFGGGQGHAVEGTQGVEDELVGGLEAVEHLDAALGEDFQVRVEAYGLAAGAGDIVDGGLAVLGAGLVVGQGGQSGSVVVGGGVEAQQGGELVAVGVVGVAELEDLAVVAPEGGVAVLVFSELGEHGQGLLGQGLADLAHQGVFLEGFAREVERQVLGVHQPAQETEVLGDELLVAAVDEHAADVEVQAVVVGVFEEGARGRVGDEEQPGELHGGVHGDVQVFQGRLGVVGQKGVELVVLLLLELELGLAPQGRGGVDTLAGQQDGEADEVGVGADDLAQALGGGEVGGVLLELDFDARAARGVGVQVFDGVAAGAGAGPAHGGCGGVGAAGGDAHFVGDHEHGVEAHAEAADDGVGPGAALLGGAAHELGGPGVGDGADILHEFLAGHADAGVGDGQGPGVLVGGYADFQGRVRVGQGGAAGLQEAQLVQGVGGVGHQLAQKDFAVGVDGVGDDLQQLGDLRLELAGALFRGHVCSSRLILLDR